MVLKDKDKARTGISVPVSSLRTSSGCGCGEFFDLIELGQWCKECGIDLIQILPVNDSGMDSSPYSPVSAFALNPIYIHTENLPGAKPFQHDIDQLALKLNKGKRVDYLHVRGGKLNLLRNIYDSLDIKEQKTAAISEWFKAHGWVGEYALFTLLREELHCQNWQDWDQLRDPSTQDIKELWDSRGEEAWFYVWMQYWLNRQLMEASQALDNMGIALKGDIPILINEDSVDVWIHREFFNLKQRAGAPPDFYSTDGQNWRFPTYDWKALKSTDYEWWRSRIEHNNQFFHAFRVDHVLGFFRIWSIPEAFNTAQTGFFSPFHYFNIKDLKGFGFSSKRLKWLSEPHIPEAELREMVGDKEAEIIIENYLDRVNTEPLFLFKSEIAGDRDIDRLTDISDNAKSYLSKSIKDICLVPVGDDRYFPLWDHLSTRSYHTLSEYEVTLLSVAIADKYSISEKLWEKQAFELLSFIKQSSDMLICAEDLGVVPRCVDTVLSKLKILSLKVVPWTRDYDSGESHLIEMDKYPECSVCTSSVHDAQTLRQWLLTEEEQEERSEFFGLKGANYASPTNIKRVLTKIVKSSSRLVVFPIQDILALDSKMVEKDPSQERINIPGTISKENWSYRIKPELKILLGNVDLKKAIQKITIKRKSTR